MFGRFRVVQYFVYNLKMRLKLTLTGTAKAQASCAAGNAQNGSSAMAKVTGVELGEFPVTLI